MSTVVSSGYEEGRDERAARLRPRVREKMRRYASERAAARDIGLSHTALRKFVKGDETPYHPTLDQYELWLSADTGLAPVGSMEDNGAETIEFFLGSFRAGMGKDVGVNERKRLRDQLRAAIRRAEAKGWDAGALREELGRLVEDEDL